MPCHKNEDRKKDDNKVAKAKPMNRMDTLLQQIDKVLSKEKAENYAKS